MLPWTVRTFPAAILAGSLQASPVIFTEINDPGEEFLEIHNPGEADLDLTGYTVIGGIDAFSREPLRPDSMPSSGIRK